MTLHNEISKVKKHLAQLENQLAELNAPLEPHVVRQWFHDAEEAFKDLRARLDRLEAFAWEVSPDIAKKCGIPPEIPY